MVCRRTSSLNTSFFLCKHSHTIKCSWECSLSYYCAYMLSEAFCLMQPHLIEQETASQLGVAFLPSLALLLQLYAAPSPSLHPQCLYDNYSDRCHHDLGQSSTSCNRLLCLCSYCCRGRRCNWLLYEQHNVVLSLLLMVCCVFWTIS